MSANMPGMAKPWVWIQPSRDEILPRLIDCRDLKVHERERENMCSVAHGEIVRLRAENADLLAKMEGPIPEYIGQQINELKADRSGLLVVLKRLSTVAFLLGADQDYGSALSQAHAAIAKAEAT